MKFNSLTRWGRGDFGLDKTMEIIYNDIAMFNKGEICDKIPTNF